MRGLCAPVLTILLALVASAAAAGDRPKGALPLSPCPIAGSTETALCGRLEVPENRARPEGRTLSLSVMVLPAIGEKTLPPLYDLAGGPGEAAGISAAFYAGDGSAYRAGRDVVLVDLRGTGASAPLRCPQLEAGSPLDRMYPPAQVRACRKTLSANADLRQYTTAASADDLDAVRAALGQDRVDIFALSYGTMLAQTWIRRHPGRVRAAVLVGTVPLGEKLPLHHGANAQRVLDLMFADCAAQPACKAAFPNLADDWQRLLRRLEAGPVSVPVGGVQKLVEQGPFLEALRALMTSSAGQSHVPRVISHAAAGDYGPFVKAVGGEGRPSGLPALAEGLYLSVACAEGTNAITDAEARRTPTGAFGRYRIDEQRQACRLWGVGSTPPPALSGPSDTAVLLLAGGRDQTAPPDWAAQVARDFPRGRLVVIAPMAHAIDGLENLDCFDVLAVAFLTSGKADELDLACLPRITAPPFATAP